MKKHHDPTGQSDWPATLRVILGLGVIWGCLFLVALAQEQSRKENKPKAPEATVKAAAIPSAPR